jgi:Rad3-related DNA helicase
MTIATDLDRDMRVDVRLRQAIESGTLPKQLLISGPAGTGKTFAILCLLHCLASDEPGLRILICRQTRVSLTDSVLITFETSSGVGSTGPAARRGWAT